MFVVKKPFRNYGVVMTVGSLVDPAVTKLFRVRLGEGKIIEVNEHNYNERNQYFVDKHGVELPALNSPVIDEEIKETPAVEKEAPVVATKAVAKAAPKAAKAVAKATAV